ncbi:hypothetical protein [Pseudoalteromonas aurantia]|uniref:Uncharacterized protein n=1 Tax=Pseudoalteromonas aurantia TaxID=43654 RepID=A0A5S3V581_9GAMM|nr:hypothetical protein [Pseudoalteromonas aurantia]TMO65652.1 hypothetical protein CWC19_17405 [Pseudoalteromonas aurantia]
MGELQNDENPNRAHSMLVSVISVNSSLHYILNNEQGEWFDSHLKERVQLWDPIETWYKSDNKRDGATWLGVSIRVFAP